MGNESVDTSKRSKQTQKKFIFKCERGAESGVLDTRGRRKLTPCDIYSNQLCIKSDTTKAVYNVSDAQKFGKNRLRQADSFNQSYSF